MGRKQKPRGIVGEVVIRPLDSVRPNDYNPHVVPPDTYESLKHGLRVDGWIAAQALLVWGTDETGARQDTIIDGEHRWRAAREIGMRQGPMVFLDGVTRQEAMALTVKLDARRGAFVEDRLAAVYRELDAAPTPEMAIDLGTSVAELERLLAAHPAPDLGLGAFADGALEGVADGRPTITGGECAADFEDIAIDLADLRAPFPWFGGKRRVAHIVWTALGNVKNYVEPFFGSGAVLLRRPGGRGPIETVNDADAYIANVWRALVHAPEEVARLADWPVNEDDLHARHKWLIGRDEFRRKMRDGDDPEYFDAKIAAWWIWGACLWIGSGWCALGAWPSEKIPAIDDSGKGVHRLSIGEQLPGLARGSEKGEVRPFLGEQLPRLVQQPSLTASGSTTENIRAWMLALAQRMRRVRVANGDFERVLTPAVTTGHGLTGVFLDPPYAEGADDIYAHHDKSVSARARKWALENGSNPLLRIVFCGYDGEHGENPFPGWRCVRWKASGGYGNNNGNEYRERIWISPHGLPRGAKTGFEPAAPPEIRWGDLELGSIVLGDRFVVEGAVRHELVCGDGLAYTPPKRVGVVVHDPPWTQIARKTSVTAPSTLVFCDGGCLGEATAAFGAPTWTFTWDCGACWYTPNRPLRRAKYCLWYGPLKAFDFDGAHYGEPLAPKTITNSRGTYNYTPDERGKHLADVYAEQLSKLHAVGDHPHEKPLDWVRLLIGTCSSGDVFDPFLGSGTTVRAADQLGRTCYGVELDPGVLQRCLLRLARHGMRIKRA